MSGVGEAGLFVRTVAVRLVRRLPAATQRDAVACLEFGAVRRGDRDAALDVQRTVVEHTDLEENPGGGGECDTGEAGVCGTGAFACRASGVGANRASVSCAASRSCSRQSGWLYVIASPQYARAKSGSISCIIDNIFYYCGCFFGGIFKGDRPARKFLGKT